MSQSSPLLEVKDLKKHFPIQRGVFRKVVGHVKAVDGISFTIDPGETLGWWVNLVVEKPRSAG